MHIPPWGLIRLLTVSILTVFAAGAPGRKYRRLHQVLLHFCDGYHELLQLLSADSLGQRRLYLCDARGNLLVQASAFGVAITCLSLASRDTEHRITNPSSSRRFSSLDAVERRI